MYTLQELFDLIDASETTTPTYLMTEFNKFNSLGVEEMTSTEAQGLYYVIQQRLTRLLTTDTIYIEKDKGINAVKRILKSNIINLTVEIRNMMKALSKDIATQHTQSKFNPVDNDDIEKAPTAIDNTTFTNGENLVAQCDYLMENSKTLGYLYSEFANICYLLGKGSSVATQSTEYASKEALNNEITRAKAAEQVLEDYCDSLDATKADVDSIGKPTTVTAMSGTLTDEQLELLQDNDKNYIIYSNNGNSTLFKKTRTTSTNLVYSSTIANTIYTLTITVSTKGYTITSENTEDFATKTALSEETTARTSADTTLQTNIDAKSTISVSSSGSSTNVVNYINVNGTEYKLPSGSTSENHLYRHLITISTTGYSTSLWIPLYTNFSTEINTFDLLKENMIVSDKYVMNGHDNDNHYFYTYCFKINDVVYFRYIYFDTDKISEGETKDTSMTVIQFSDLVTQIF